VKTLNLRKFPNVLLLAIKREEGWVYNSVEDYVLEKDDTLIIMTTPEEKFGLEKIFI
jgi:uncharacterized protein with PhoU and TrkA domain